MSFLRRTIVKLVLVALVVFIALPFIYGNEEEEKGEFSPFEVRRGLSYQENPVSRLVNKLSSFYGFSQPKMKTVGERVNMGQNIGNSKALHKALDKNQVNEKDIDSVNENKEETSQTRGKPKRLPDYNSGYEKYFDESNAPAGVLEKENNVNVNITNNINTFAANTSHSARSSSENSSRKYRNYEGGDPTIYEPARGSALATSATSVDYNKYVYNKTSDTPVAHNIQIDGVNYDIVQDITGKKYVVTAKGHVPFDVMLRNTVSEREISAAKKQLVNASDSQIIQYILAQKQAAYEAEQGDKSDGNVRLETVKDFVGSEAKGKQYIKTDVGVSDKMIREVYEGLRSYNAKGGNIDTSVSVSSSGGTNAGINHGDTVIAGVNISNMDRNISGRVQNSYAATQALNKDAEKKFGQNYDNDAEISETDEDLDIDPEQDPDSDTDGKKKRKTWLGRWWDEKRKSIIEYQRPYWEKYRAAKQERKEKRKQKREDRKRARAEKKAEKQALKDNQSPNEQEQKD